MNEPRHWTASELARDVERAKTEFRRQRLHEPLDVYSRFFRTFAPIFADIIDRLPALIENPCDPEVGWSAIVRPAEAWQAASIRQVTAFT